MNPDLDKLRDYPFQRLSGLLAREHPPGHLHPISLSLGEPCHPAPEWIGDILATHWRDFGKYPVTRGMPGLRSAAANWLERRYRLHPARVDPERMVLPLNGTREGLFSLVQAVTDTRRQAIVVMPNPFYQIYEGATLLAGGEPYYLDATEHHDFLPDLDRVPVSVWRRCQLLFLCTPGNPTGAVMDREYLSRAIELADRHDFLIASDECYADIYLDESRPPVGLLQVCAELGRNDWNRCLVFHSLSKRSNLPGLRSGFVAGDAGVIQAFLRYRSYHGCAMAIPVQKASIAAWRDEDHVRPNRGLYREKFAAVLPLLREVMEVPEPRGGFYLWPRTPVDGETFARRLYAEQHVTVLPGSYLARDGGQGNPGRERIRISLVASLQDCVEATRRICNFSTDLRP